MIRILLCFAIVVIAGHALSGEMASLVRPVSARDDPASVDPIRGRATSGDANLLAVDGSTLDAARFTGLIECWQ